MPRHRPADRVGIGLGVGLAGDQRRRLGGAVDLLQVDAERAEEAVGVGTERRAAGVAPARLAQAELVAHRAVDQDLAQREAQRGRPATAPCRRCASARSARRGRGNSSKTRRFSGEASPPLTCIWVSMFSQMRGGASMASGPSSRRSRCTVSGFSGQLAVRRADQRHAEREGGVADPGHRQVGQPVVAGLDVVRPRRTPRPSRSCCDG